MNEMTEYTEVRRLPLGRDFVAGDNLTLGHRGTWRLTETEIEFEAIEPG
jgi:hypothetical protein